MTNNRTGLGRLENPFHNCSQKTVVIFHFEQCHSSKICISLVNFTFPNVTFVNYQGYISQFLHDSSIFLGSCAYIYLFFTCCLGLSCQKYHYCYRVNIENILSFCLGSSQLIKIKIFLKRLNDITKKSILNLIF